LETLKDKEIDTEIDTEIKNHQEREIIYEVDDELNKSNKDSNNHKHRKMEQRKSKPKTSMIEKIGGICNDLKNFTKSSMLINTKFCQNILKQANNDNEKEFIEKKSDHIKDYIPHINGNTQTPLILSKIKENLDNSKLLEKEQQNSDLISKNFNSLANLDINNKNINNINESTAVKEKDRVVVIENEVIDFNVINTFRLKFENSQNSKISYLSVNFNLPNQENIFSQEKVEINQANKSQIEKNNLNIQSKNIVEYNKKRNEYIKRKKNKTGCCFSFFK